MGHNCMAFVFLIIAFLFTLPTRGKKIDDLVNVKKSKGVIKILKGSFKSRKHIQKKGTWAIFRSFRYSSLICDPDNIW